MVKNSRETLDKRNQLKREWFIKLKDTDFPKTILKKCKDCGEIKECSWQHSFTQTGVPEYRCRCIKCFKKYLSRLKKRTKPQRNKSLQKMWLRRKTECVDLLGGQCIKCGYDKSLYALTFHHRIPKEKVIEISVAIRNYSFKHKILQNELKKCDLLCFNCHMELHGGERNV